MMRAVLSSLFTVAVVLAIGISASFAQSADNRGSIIPRPENEDRPKTLAEMMEKLRIEKDKKDYQEMLDRGDQALKLTEEIERTVETRGKLTSGEYEKVAAVEKLVKKIRNELGGDDDDDKEKEAEPRLSPVEAAKKLRAATLSLIDQLKKTSRFSISAAAIQSSNSVLRVARFLRITK
jgi:hypothetical protein